MDAETIMEKALEQSELINTCVKRFEYARVSLEQLDLCNRNIEIHVKADGVDFTLKKLPDDKLDAITYAIRAQYQSEIDESCEICRKIIADDTDGWEPLEDVEDRPISSRTFVNEEFDKLFDEPKEEEKKPELKEEIKEEPEAAVVPNAVIPEKFKEEKAQRYMSKNVVSDADLKRMYFKEGKKVQEIADSLKINPASIYKRIHDMKEEQAAKAKECASSKRR